MPARHCRRCCHIMLCGGQLMARPPQGRAEAGRRMQGMQLALNRWFAGRWLRRLVGRHRTYGTPPRTHVGPARLASSVLPASRRPDLRVQAGQSCMAQHRSGPAAGAMLQRRHGSQWRAAPQHTPAPTNTPTPALSALVEINSDQFTATAQPGRRAAAPAPVHRSAHLRVDRRGSCVHGMALGLQCHGVLQRASGRAPLLPFVPARRRLRCRPCRATTPRLIRLCSTAGALLVTS